MRDGDTVTDWHYASMFMYLVNPMRTCPQAEKENTLNSRSVLVIKTFSLLSNTLNSSVTKLSQALKTRRYFSSRSEV